MIECKDLHLSVGTFNLSSISLEVPKGAYATLMGRTGCGKTTVLESICGLHRVSAGCVSIDGADVTYLSPGARGLGYVPQDGAMFPMLNVREHLAFAPQVQQWPHEKVTERVTNLAKALGISHLLDRRVQGLSGGERQRVALGRALAARPAALLLDEPLSALDEGARDEMISLLRDIQRAENVTVLHVTHSPREAEALASVRLIMEDGAIRAG
jgi:ABC-type sugar transport system ATPase subunit